MPDPSPATDAPTDRDAGGATDGEPDGVVHPEVVEAGPIEGAPTETTLADNGRESVEQPAKVMRIGSMIKQLLDEVRAAPLDDKSRDRMKSIFDESVRELADSLSPDLRNELERLAPPFTDASTPSDSELRVAQAQLVGWLEGLFHGIQATLFAQQMQARQQLEEMRRQLPPGTPGTEGLESPADTRPGTYL
ncbi:MAG: bacterial proteasome activator family protein [Acidimicrobiales bacterium]